jgi:predicted amidohydrolase
MNKIRIASLQMKVLEDKYDNIERLAELVADGAAEGADILSLGEIWNSP